MVTKVPQRIIASTGVTIGSYTNSSITVNQSGQITSASSGSPQETTPKITSIQVTNSSYQILDDTAVDVLGGYIKIIGTGFSAGCQVLINNVAATSTTFVSATEVRAQVPATIAGTYVIYLVNSDGGVAIRVNGITFSATPSWVTASILSDGTVDSAISIQLAATSATTYQLQAGSTLPTGLSLSGGGLLSGTVTGIANDTTYSFTVVATDLENQDSPRTFSITIGVSDPYYRLTTLYLPGNSGATIVTDASTNNFPITVLGDSRASNFSPYLTGWSNLTDCSTSGASRVDVPASGIFGTDVSYTIEGWYNFTTVSTGDSTNIIHSGSYPARWVIDANVQSTTIALRIVTESNAVLFNGTSVAYIPGSWVHIAIVNDNTANTLTFYINGTAAGSRVKTSLTTYATLNIGYGTGNASTPYFVSNFRIVSGSALYSANFTPSTIPLTAVAGTALLIFQSNRFVDASATPRTLTVNGSNQIRSFNPFGLTNTGTTGSMYFDGTGDYITVPHNTALDFSNNNFTIEFWMYLQANNVSLIGKRSGSDYAPFLINAASDYYIRLYHSTDGANWTVGAASTIAYKLNQWHHIAVVRNGTSTNNVTLYQDGQVAATGSLGSTALVSNSLPVHIGADGNGTSSVNGYISNVRLIKGTAIYTAAFTPPATPLTAVANTQLLTLQNKQPHNNSSFQDSSTNNFLITRSGNTTQGTFSPFSQSGWSTLFNGSNGLSVPSNAALSFSGEFTFETFVYYNAIPGSGGAASFIMRRSNSASGSSFQFGLTNTSGQFKYFITISVGSTDYDTNWNISTPSVGRWYHVAIVRDNSSNMHCWLDGVKLILSGGNSNIPGTTNVPSTDVSIGWRNYYNDLYLNGYLSNLRLSAAALYSGSTFTVPTQAFDPSQANTRLLICHTRRFVDQGSANLTIGFNYYPSVQAFSPFAPTAVYSPATHGGSAYFDGSGDYLSTASDAAFTLGSSENFTLEFWIYLNGAQTSNSVIATTYNDWNSDFTNRWALRINSTLLSWLASSGSTSIDTTLIANMWTHVAVVRSASTITMYINGVSVGAQTTLMNYTTQGSIKIGFANSANYFNGYLTNFRLVKGTAVYTSNFTPPTAPVTATTNTSLLLNFTNGAIADATGRNVIETLGDARTTSVVTKWAGSSSMYFDGTGDYLQMPDSELLELGSADFTIEAWVYPTLIAGTNRVVLGHGTSGSQWLAFYVDANGYVTFAAVASSTIIDRTATSRAVSLNTWTHVAVSRSGSTFRLFIDGSEPTYTGSPSSSSSAMPNFATPFRIGAQRWDGDSGIFQGYMQDLRITRGYARYIANFTPPTGSFKLR